MTAKELRELDQYIAVHVMGWNRVHGSHVPVGSFVIMPDGCVFVNEPTMRHFSPTTDPASAMEVLKKAAEKQAENYDTYRPAATIVIYAPCVDSKHWLVASDEQQSVVGEAPTLELAICLFSKNIYSK